MEIDISKIIIDKRNDFFGIYIDTVTSEYIYCLIDNNIDDNILMINLIAKYIVQININSYKMSYYSFTDVEPHSASPTKIYYYIGKKVKINKKDKFCDIIKDKNNIISIKLKLFDFDKLFIKKYTNIDIKPLLSNNKTIHVTRGGTRQVILLDNIVLKQSDPTCNIYCEQITNYYAKTFDISLADLIGIVFYDKQPMIVELKYTPIDWEKCLINIDEYMKYKIKFDELVININEHTILGDYNLSNVLLNTSNNKLIITDFNGTLPTEFIARELITNIQNANNFNIRLSDYLTDGRILTKIGIGTFLNKYVFYNILLNILNNYNTIIRKSVSTKYLKYKQKYITLKNKIN